MKEVLLNPEQKLGGVGASDIGKLFTKAGLSAKTAHSLALEKAEELITGERKKFTTAAMLHGIYSEPDAFNDVIKPLFPNSIYQSDVSILIADIGQDARIWASPDVVDESEPFTLDIKCPVSVYTYAENIRKTPDTYIVQNQMQMMATGHKQGYLLFYLTAREVDEFGNKMGSEYNIDISERHTFIPVSAMDEYHQEIYKRAEDFFVLRDAIYNDIAKAIAISDEELFHLIFKEKKKVTRLKDKSNLSTWGGKIYHTPTEGYLVVE